MDRDAFDGLAKLLAASPSRRAALGVLIGGGLAGALGATDANKDRKKRGRGKQGRDTAQISAQAADCSNPGPSTNISGCPFQDADFSGDDLSGSRMVGTNFRRAELVGTDLSSSNARNAVFREADLTCADLRSSTLGGADFRAADLTGANLKSSGGCNSATFNAATTFCYTTMCDGSVRNDDCPSGFDPEAFCCADGDCLGGLSCVDNQCANPCPPGWVLTSNGTCGFPCSTQGTCTSIGCFGCFTILPDQIAVCVDGSLNSVGCPACPVGEVCQQGTGCRGVCGPATP